MTLIKEFASGLCVRAVHSVMSNTNARTYFFQVILLECCWLRNQLAPGSPGLKCQALAQSSPLIGT